MADIEQIATKQSPSYLVRASVTGPPNLGQGATERERVLSSLPYIARKIVGANYGALTVMNHEGTIERMFVSGVSQASAESMGHPPVGKGLLGLMAVKFGAIFVDRIQNLPNSAGFPPGHPKMDTMLGVAVENDGRHVANLYLANEPGSLPFTPEDVAIVESISHLAATSIENARLFRQEEVLRWEADQSRSWLEAVIGQASVGILVVDSSTGRVLLSSAQAAQIIGVPIPVGASASEYETSVRWINPGGGRISEEDLPIRITRNTGQHSGPTEFICQRPDGRRIPILMSAAPVPAGGARSGGVVAVIQDITRSKELDEVKSEFLSMITHDLRGPLATIKGLTDALASALQDNDEVMSDIEAIDEEIDQTTDLVSNLLDMSRIEAGSYPLELEVSHLIDLVGDAQNRAFRSRLGNDRNIDFSQDADMPPAYVDPRQIGRILDNLISNALKYSDSDVWIRSEYNDKDRVIKTSVSDTGIGIPTEIRPLVFDKFFRVTAGASVARGVGLGLAICKAIVEAHGGRIGVQPTDGGVGSTFWFTIPSYHENVIQPQKAEA